MSIVGVPLCLGAEGRVLLPLALGHTGGKALGHLPCHKQKNRYTPGRFTTPKKVTKT
jgi:hypothetical protein